ncbi:MAG: transposase, partial [Dehalobacter sp. 4CP]|nr:transposase [Dehalobacter sp. 4CP]
MCMKKTFRYRIRLSKSAETNLKNHLELCRQLYNLALEQRITIWKNYRKSISIYDQSKQLPDLKKAFPEFKQVNSQALQDVIERLGKAFDGFFRRIRKGQKPGFPRFRGYNRHDSVTLKQTGWKLEGRYLTITNIGKIKLFLSRPMEGEIKTVTICRTATGKWFVCFSCNNVAEKILPDTGRETGIDVG